MPRKRKTKKTKVEVQKDDDEELEEELKNNEQQTPKKPPSIRSQLNLLTVPILKQILRYNHQNPFGIKQVLLTRISYLVKNGGYPPCPKCKYGRLKLRKPRKTTETKYYCPGFPSGFGEGDSFIRCNYETDDCTKTNFNFTNPIHSQIRRQLQKLSVSSSLSPKPSQTPPSTSLSIGQEIHGYIVNEIESVPEYRLTAIKLQHKLTGCEHLHIDREHKNNVWSVAFQTTPRDDTGVAHILEHTSLCGSDKFPCRDPFFKMTNRSMATFMNAFTASDWTMYVFSTQNQKDYFNLMSVYLDAVLHPKLDQYDFLQEGWRLEHENVNDSSSPIVLKGVVFNEMKGAFSDSHQLFSRRVQNSLMPASTYRYESGGDPESIPSLTWNGLKEFHAKHYHPSNSRFFTYGTFPLTDTLEYLNDYLINYTKQQKAITSTLLEEPRWKQQKTERIACAPQSFVVDQEKTTTVSISYLLGSIRDVWETFLLGIVGSLLVDSEKSPFYKKLIIPNIGTNYSPDTGFDRSTLNTSFHVGLQDISNGDVDRVLKLINETFAEVARDGFEQSQIDAILHQIELGMKHQDENFGLRIITNLIYSWIHEADPVESLKSTKFLDRFNKEIKKNPKLLQEMVEKYFLNNQHKLIAIMNPDEEYSEKKKRKEMEICQKLISQYENKRDIYEQGLELQKRQSAPQNVDVLPTLAITDIDKNIIQTPIIKTQIGNK
ncbi:unnamed protein product [Didymodactylos carnosus]|uniref:Presequence protease, mitochondrial n=1 Tax=Didymodactylos carnosus TaxID=1234261 RepID=A0A8S2GE59_9BILA|nr:unnamed protein product [Didymodactylos carnosus]CAF3502175.1 unnamed protein product [Didymodactylos carnosus]